MLFFQLTVFMIESNGNFVAHVYPNIKFRSTLWRICLLSYMDYNVPTEIAATVWQNKEMNCFQTLSVPVLLST